jgi:hypothetical protein
MNFREGIRRVGILLGVLGGTVAGFFSYFLAVEVHNSYVAGVLRESLLADTASLIALPILGFLIPWGATRVFVWIWAGFSK